MNASSPEFLYNNDIKKLSEAILWLIDGVDNDIVAAAIHNVSFERKFAGSIFSREDIYTCIKEFYFEEFSKEGYNIPDDDAIDSMTDSLLESEWWMDNSLGLKSSFDMYQHVENYIRKNDNRHRGNISSDNI